MKDDEDYREKEYFMTTRNRGVKKGKHNTDDTEERSNKNVTSKI